MKKPQEIIRIISCNGEREMTEERIVQAMKEYALSLLPSEEEIHSKPYYKDTANFPNELGTREININWGYIVGRSDFKNEIINKLK